MKFSGLFFLALVIFASCKTVKNPPGAAENRDKPVISKKETGSESDLNFQSLINAWLGSPYKYGGCTKDGTDCSGMVFTFYKEVYGIELPRSSNEIYQKARKIEESQAKPGDLVFFTIKNNQVSHVGMYMNDRKFIHSSTSKGVIISSLNEPYYKERLKGFGSFR